MAQSTAEPRVALLQQDRSRETRRRLIDTAQRLWRKHGFDEVAVSEICESAGVSKGTFFYYFRRKEDLLVELALVSAEQAWEEWEDLEQRKLSTRESLKAVISSTARRAEQTPRPLLARTMMELFRHAGDWESLRGERTDLHKIFAAIFANGKRAGDVSRSKDVDELASILTATLLQGMLFWARDEDRESLEALLWRRTDMLLKGFLAGR